MNIICLDIETTGLDPDSDEILQLSIIDGSGEILFSEYILPTEHDCWPSAQKVNHISPAMVQDCKPLLYYADTIQRILEDADVIVGYNIRGFDLPFIFNGGIGYDAKPGAIVVDVMIAFAKIYGKHDDYHGGYKRQKLRTCASYYSYYKGKAHNALDDARATLFCFYKIFGDPPKLSRRLTGVYRSTSNFVKRKSPNPVKTVSTPKSGNLMIGFGFFVLLVFFSSFDPFWLVIAALLLYFGFKRHKIYKNFKQDEVSKQAD